VTVYANRFDTGGVVFRLHLQAGMLAVVGLAASTSAAVGAQQREVRRLLRAAAPAAGQPGRLGLPARSRRPCQHHLVRAGPSRRNAIVTVTT